MATHSSVLAWKIPWTEGPGGLQFILSQRVRYSWVTEHAQRLVHYSIQISKLMYASWKEKREAFHWLAREMDNFIYLLLSEMVLMMGCLHKVHFGWYKDTNCNLGFIEERRIIFGISLFSSVQFSSVTQSCLNLCDPMDCSRQASLFHHQLLEFGQIHVH